MKVCKIIIRGYQQFQDFELDLTNPNTGEPLDKFCFIGSNGTGKTTLLNIIRVILTNFRGNSKTDDIAGFDKKLVKSGICVKIKVGEAYYYLVKFPSIVVGTLNFKILPIEQRQFIVFENAFLALFKEENTIVNKFKNKVEKIFTDFGDKEVSQTELTRQVFGEVNTLVTNIPADNSESFIEIIDDMPNTNLNNAISLFNYHHIFHTISLNTVGNFWTNLIFLIKKRESDWLKFQDQKQNLDKTIREVRAKFDAVNPKILKSISDLWNKILEKAGLFFDYQNAQIPIQLNENLKAYIKLRSTGEPIQYNQLSTGIRNFIFKIGHLYSLYFDRNIANGMLLVDEPENSLHPDFLYDIVDTYVQIVENTQIGMATHNSIIASQFESYERFIFSFNEIGTVEVRRGSVPIGDDPNDILRKDFGLRSILGVKGIEKWERYIELKRLIPKEKNENEKRDMLKEFMIIGNAYNFAD